jgi:hypothetical protein
MITNIVRASLIERAPAAASEGAAQLAKRCQ